MLKKIALSLLILAGILPLHADNLIQNGDFTDGITHWHGDAQGPADFAPANPFDKPDPFTSKGLIVTLKDNRWRKVAQDFTGKITGGVLTITFMVSPDLAFSASGADYVGVPHKIGYDGWAPFNTTAGAFVFLISDFGSSTIWYNSVTPELGSSKVQTIKDKLTSLTPKEDKTITLAFPPGKGTIVILSVTLTDN